ncbi:MAG: hypothetical protein GYB65_01505 [Chloroflexi bacterium]|nr:hypothetical protein [Chloroflexota bacterium]
MHCPRCGAQHLEYTGPKTLRCTICGFGPFRELAAGGGESGAVATPDHAIIRRIAPPPVPIDLPAGFSLGYVAGLDDYERVRFEGHLDTALIALRRDDHDAAREALQAALEINKLSDQVWLFMAGLAEDAPAQREYLQQALACNPNNQLALETLLRLDGRLAQVDRVFGRERPEPGREMVKRIACPRCGGNLAYHTGQGEVMCRSCGHRILDVDEMERSGQQTPLTVGLLTRKFQERPWNIGKRWLRCGECGAITTLSRRTLTNTCRFCTSQQVLQEGVYLRFQQPDFILPFALDEANVRVMVRHRLRGGFRGVARLLSDVGEHVELHPVFLPFWVFDAQMTVHWSIPNARDRGQHPVLVGDVLFPAAEALPAELVRQLEPYDLQRGVDYDPRLLVSHPAELYTVDVDRAAMDVQPILRQHAEQDARPVLSTLRPTTRSWYERYDERGWGGGRLRTEAGTRYMSYRLGLLPVWIGRLGDGDGAARQVVVNGQTGQVALSAHKERE